MARSGQVRSGDSGQVGYVTRPESRTMVLAAFTRQLATGRGPGPPSRTAAARSTLADSNSECGVSSIVLVLK